MIRNYLKIAWRNLMKNKVFSFINILGLSTGLTCCMLISFYLYYELSYDAGHKNSKQLYQLGTDFMREGSQVDRTANTPAPIGAQMQQVFPEVQMTTRLMRTFADDKTLLQLNAGAGEKKSFYETKGFMADSTFFRMFTYHFSEGNPATALSQPNSLVISKEIADKMFGQQPALNQVVHISSSTNGDYDFRVTGVFVPDIKPSHIDARFFMSMTGGQVEKFSKATNYANNNMFSTYLMLKPGADAKGLEAKFPSFVEKYEGKDLKYAGFKKKQFLIPLRDIHLNSDVRNNVSAGGNITYLYILASIALFTLLIACINFMNLSTARSSKRSAEVGVRKVLGAERSSLIRQFLGESLLMSFIAFLFSLAFTLILLPLFASVSGKDLRFSWEEHGSLVAGFFLLAMLTGILAGSYPAFYLSSFRPVKVLKGKFQNSFAAVSLRKALVIIQFAISVVLIIASVVISRQMNFLKTTDLGFSKDQQVVIPLRSRTAKKAYTSLTNIMRNNPDIISVGASEYYPGIINPSDLAFYREGQNSRDAVRTYMNGVDEGLLKTLNLKLLAGRMFSEQYPADTNNRLVLNEQSVRKLGFTSPSEAIGKTLYFDYQDSSWKFEVVGVVRDFHFQDLHSNIEPYGFHLNQHSFNYIIAHAQTGSLGKALAFIERSWHSVNPDEPFEYSFLDEDFARNYQSDNRLASIVSYFTIIAILISCLGLFGLATFSAEQKTREIGIRKVLGASTGNIVALLSTGFMKLVGIAILVAAPIAWYTMNKWLGDFAYRITIGWWMFLVAAILAMFIAFLTISLQAVKAAHTNPVKNLRTE